ncbi:hypothetical protein [uncultured Sphingorhabdus sp.]|jgi:hypothetical protein|uniref:hypothetical protein n=1 Tax=uncultured Sphingorhabdus sp. TaxID=1686106 RepID=UPI00262F9941|nr:hypothetical protein [uncultured Sphingorhabdus sp.]HMS21110.1 hypothetical protein [Sphingorhabdus sp.]
MILSKPKTLDEAWQLDENDSISMADAIALCFRENDLEEGRAILANVKNMERARIKQREISGTVHQLLWLAIASVGANKAWTSGYWPIAIIIAAIWTYTSVQIFKSIRAEYKSRFAEIIFADEEATGATQPSITIGLFRQYIESQKEQAASPWNIIELGEDHFAPAVLRKQA